MRRTSPARLAIAAVVVVVAFWLASFVAGLVGWSFEPKGWHRVREGIGVLVMSWVIATAGIATARAVAGRPPMTWWLLAGATPPLFFGLAEGLGAL